LKNLANYLRFIKEHHLEQAAKEIIVTSQEVNFPLSKKYGTQSPELLLQHFMKELADFADNLTDGSYVRKQEQTILKWDDTKVEGISRKSVEPRDLVLIFAVQRRTLRKFLPLYTKDLQLVLLILNELDDLHQTAQSQAFQILFKWEKEKEAELRQSNTFLDTVLDNIPNMIFVKEANELRFIRFNKAGEELLGYKKEDLLGKNDYDFFPKEQADFFTQTDRVVIDEKKAVDIIAESIQTAFKGERWLHTQKIPVFAPDGVPLYLVGISEDITERKEREDAIKQLNKELESFSYSVSHDLRAPLRAINGYAKILEEEYASKMDEEMRRLVEVIVFNSEKMGILIDELLTFSRLGRKEIQKTKVDMNELVEGVVYEMGKTVKHQAEIHIEKLPVAEADYGLIHQVMINLISNAVKYSSKNESPKVWISGKREGKEFIFCVKDNGAGFNMKYVGKLFGVFQRLHSNEEFEGVGVGLAIVHRIVTRHGGKVWAEGKEKAGASFYFTLPVSKKEQKG
jgi:PAS domain S-box-containing protein